MSWPDGRPVTLSHDAFCRHGQRLFGLARHLAECEERLVQLICFPLNGIEDGNLEDKYRWEQGFTLQAYMSADSAETRRAFVEKRDADFKNKKK